ncbi:MAG: crotonase/enoyl-CoA hydratase family protein [Rhodobacterales bacterium]|nr:crotonase/enoyl-CoA hydratase family protein [Rhodobacterales bacterium]
MFETIRLETCARGIARLTLMRPDRHNALSGLMIDELTQAAGQLAQDRAVRAVVLTGAGDSFCAGADLGWMQAQVQADRATRAQAARALAGMLQALNTLPMPLIGRINGPAYGGGVGLMAVCDLALGVQGAQFGLTEVRLGLIPATIGPYVVARLGESGARRVFFSGTRFGADEAASLGLLARVLPAEALDAAVEAALVPYLAAAPGAVARAKALVRALGPRIDAATVEMTVQALVDTWDAPEAAEGIAAFLERRKPFWAG